MPFPEWSRALGEDSKELDFLLSNEDEFGYTTSTWKYPTNEANYEIRLMSKCDCDRCPKDLTLFTTDSIYGSIDKTAPHVIGLPTPQVNLQPGEEIVVEFNEDVECELPYTFKVWMEISEISSKIFSDDDFDIVCSENVIKIQFIEDNIPGSSFRKLLGRTYILTIQDVKDLSGNVMEESYIFESNFVCLPPVPQLSISTNNARQYLPHEPMIFNATISNYQEKWVTISKLSLPDTVSIYISPRQILFSKLAISYFGVALYDCFLHLQEVRARVLRKSESVSRDLLVGEESSYTLGHESSMVLRKESLLSGDTPQVTIGNEELVSAAESTEVR